MLILEVVGSVALYVNSINFGAKDAAERYCIQISFRARVEIQDALVSADAFQLIEGESGTIEEYIGANS